jgi:hypothetical protein
MNYLVVYGFFYFWLDLIYLELKIPNAALWNSYTIFETTSLIAAFLGSSVPSAPLSVL